MYTKVLPGIVLSGPEVKQVSEGKKFTETRYLGTYFAGLERKRSRSIADIDRREKPKKAVPTTQGELALKWFSA